MQSIEMKGLEELSKDLDKLLKEIPEARRELHEELAQLIKTEVDIQIESSGLNDTRGKIRGWQKSYVGSGGGYAAVRATDKSAGDNSPGAITNYLESGHKIRTPSGRSKRYRPKIKTPFVEGRHFYQGAQRIVDAKAIAKAEQFAEKLARRIEEGSKF